MSSYKAGNRLRLTEDGRRVTVWSPGPNPGTYWCHVEEVEDVLLVRIVDRRDATQPIVTLVEAQ